MFRSLLFTLTSILIFTFHSSAQRKKIISDEPQLIVGIVIEDMRYDYIDRFWDNFSEGGFKKMVQEGSFCKNANYNYMLTQTSSGMATIATGCEPVIHGIVSDRWHNQLKGKNIRSVYDDKVVGLNDEKQHWTCSPTHLLTTTFTDELKLYNNHNSRAVGVCMYPEGAILPIGHLGDAAYWFNDETGNWISSSYYMDSLPKWVNDFNAKGFPDIYKEQEWLPTFSLDQYRSGSTQGNSKQIGFSNTNRLSRRLGSYLQKNAAYAGINATPYGITLTKDFAIAAIVNDSLGKKDYTDFLNICFSASANVTQACGPNSIEMEDLYIRIDKDLEHLLQFLEGEFGRENFVVYLTSDHGTSYNPDALSAINIPSGRFDGERAVMLLGTYLNAIYDKGNWVSSYHNKQIYLNHNLIEKAEIPLADFQNTVADFIVQFTGVANAITASTLEETNFTHGVFYYMQNSFNQKRSGDIIINLEPGWIEANEKTVSTGNSANKYDRHVPLIWYGWKIKRNRIEENIYIKDIAPTISNFMHIPYPNGCTGEPIDGLIR